jgi:hypothetical protein
MRPFASPTKERVLGDITVRTRRVSVNSYLTSVYPTECRCPERGGGQFDACLPFPRPGPGGVGRTAYKCFLKKPSICVIAGPTYWGWS